MRTVITCANSSGRVVLEDSDPVRWEMNDQDGIGQEVWHLAVPLSLCRDLGANLLSLVVALNARGLGFAVEGPNDRDADLLRQRRQDDEFTRRLTGRL